MNKGRQHLNNPISAQTVSRKVTRPWFPIQAESASLQVRIHPNLIYIGNIIILKIKNPLLTLTQNMLLNWSNFQK